MRISDWSSDVCSSDLLNVVGFGWLVPLLKIAAGDHPRHQLRELRQQLLIPLVGIAAFLALWAGLAPQVHTSLGAIPGPAQVWEQAVNLYQDHKAERAKEAAFYARQDERNKEQIGRATWRERVGQYG